MIIREVSFEEKEAFNQVATHPLQSWEWGDFREKTGKKIIRLGVYEEKKLKEGYQISAHPIPHTNFTILYFPKGPMPDKNMIEALLKLGKKERAVFIKIEPNVGSSTTKDLPITARQEIHRFLLKNNCRPGKPFFFKHTYQIDLEQSKEKILAAMHPKTRYNIRLASRHGVKVEEDNSQKAFAAYLKLTQETTKRQKFYAHSRQYHQKMWETLRPTGIAHLLVAKYKEKILTAWVLFLFNKILYYPYGASSREHREAMPSYALAWEAIKFGQKQSCKTFDFWGCLGPQTSSRHPWAGFTRFKAGFGGKLVEFIGTYDLVIEPRIYPLYNLANEIRWLFLKLKTFLPF